MNDRSHRPVIAVTGDIFLSNAERARLEAPLNLLAESGTLIRTGTANGVEALMRTALQNSVASTFQEQPHEIYPAFPVFGDQELQLAADNYAVIQPSEREHDVFAQDLMFALDPSTVTNSEGSTQAKLRFPYMLLGRDLQTPANALVVFGKSDLGTVNGPSKALYELSRRLGIRTYNLGFAPDLARFMNEVPGFTRDGWPTPPLGNRFSFAAKINAQEREAADNTLNIVASESTRGKAAIRIAVERLEANRHYDNGVYVGRWEQSRIPDSLTYRGDLGNPIYLNDKSAAARTEVAMQYQERIASSPAFGAKMNELAAYAIKAGGITLVCHCHPALCHAHIQGAAISDIVSSLRPDLAISTNFSEQAHALSRGQTERITTEARLEGLVNERFRQQGIAPQNVPLEGRGGTVALIERGYAVIEPAGSKTGTYSVVQLNDLNLSERDVHPGQQIEPGSVHQGVSVETPELDFAQEI